MGSVKTVASLVLLLASLHGAAAWFCYSHTPEGEKDQNNWVFCPSTSCYTVAATLLGMGDSKRGCADKSYPDDCQEASNIVSSGNVCFCNTLLCNNAIGKLPSFSLPFLTLVAFLVHKFM